MLQHVSGLHDFLLQSTIPLWICHILFIYSSLDGHLGHYFLASMNNASVNILTQFPPPHLPWTYIFISPGSIPINRILDHMVTLTF